MTTLISLSWGKQMAKRLSFVAAMLTMLSSSVRAQTVVSTCEPVDHLGKGLREDFAQIVSDSSKRQLTRRSQYHLPSAPDSAVVQVVDDSLCAVAGKIFTANGAAPPAKLYLYRVADVFIAVRRHVPNSEFEAVVTLDSTLKRALSSVAR